jgi:glyoxylase-like metal-dependent hydrolase (beta-lactamase superfamily II)
VNEIVPGIQTWSVHSAEKGFDFNGYAIQTGEGTVLVDPPEPDESGWALLDLLAPYQGVYVTNRNHSRAAATFRDRYGVRVCAHEADAERAEVDVDEPLNGGETVAGDVEVVHVPGKSPGEIALYVPGKRALIVGDLVIGVPDGELSTYPDEVIKDKEALRRSAASLAELDFDALLLCDGKAFQNGGREALRRFVENAPPSQS